LPRLGIAKGIAYASKKVVPFAPGHPVVGNGSILKNRIESLITNGMRNGKNFYPEVVALFAPEVMANYFGSKSETMFSDDLALESFRRVKLNTTVQVLTPNYPRCCFVM
jgi:hypothetical protein